VWIAEGFLCATPGNVIDHGFIRDQVLKDFERYDVRELAFDPWNANQFVTDLQSRGVEIDRLVKFHQNFANYAEPTKRLIEELILARKLAHLANPILRWMAGNLVVLEDSNGNKKPDRKSKRGKIDGIAALIMALGRAIANTIEDGNSYSDGRGVMFV
jgi:phage terminase large subunit-like protein